MIPTAPAKTGRLGPHIAQEEPHYDIHIPDQSVH